MHLGREDEGVERTEGGGGFRRSMQNIRGPPTRVIRGRNVKPSSGKPYGGRTYGNIESEVGFTTALSACPAPGERCALDKLSSIMKTNEFAGAVGKPGSSDIWLLTVWVLTFLRPQQSMAAALQLRRAVDES
ncbi:hypothetical protein KM043_012921 [Ampulex compressa]|nr:hypothetical protein KM043_012921 [Ampulex compressa]